MTVYNDQESLDLPITDTPIRPKAGRRKIFIDNNGQLALLASNGFVSRMQQAAGNLAADTLVIDIDTTTETGAPNNRTNGRPALLPAGTFVTLIEIVVTEQFGAELTSFQLGKDGTENWLIDDAEHNLRETAPGVTRIVNNQVSSVDTPLLVTASQSGNATGVATILVRYSAY